VKTGRNLLCSEEWLPTSFHCTDNPEEEGSNLLYTEGKFASDYTISGPGYNDLQVRHSS